MHGELGADGRIDRDEGVYYRNDMEDFDITGIVSSRGQWIRCLSKTDDPNLRKKMGTQGLVIDVPGFFFEITHSLEQELGMKIGVRLYPGRPDMILERRAQLSDHA